MMLLKELNANVNTLCTSGTLKSTSCASRAISAVAELLVWFCVKTNAVVTSEIKLK